MNANKVRVERAPWSPQRARARGATARANRLRAGQIVLQSKESRGRGSRLVVARLFVLPSIEHCNSRPAADIVDHLRHLEDWVEHGKASPYLLIGKYLGHGSPHDADNFGSFR